MNLGGMGWFIYKSKANVPDGSVSDWLFFAVFGLAFAGLIGITIVSSRRPMLEKEREVWEQNRAAGKVRFVMKGAVMSLLGCLWGLILFKAIRGGGLFNITTAEAEVDVFIGLLFLFIGIAAGIARWDEQEKRYKEVPK